jgi:hypothetical protein
MLQMVIILRLPGDKDKAILHAFLHSFLVAQTISGQSPKSSLLLICVSFPDLTKELLSAKPRSLTQNHVKICRWPRGGEKSVDQLLQLLQHSWVAKAPNWPFDVISRSRKVGHALRRNRGWRCEECRLL